MKSKDSIIRLISYSFIALWGYAIISKLIDFESSRAAMLMQPFPNWIAEILIWAIPLIEFFILILLLKPSTRKRGLQASMILMILFSGYIAILLTGSFGKIPCACMGYFSNLDHKEHLIVNILITLLAVIAILLTHRSQAEIDASSILSRRERSPPECRND